MSRKIHPIYAPNGIALTTSATENLSDTLHQWLWNGATGGLVFGAARIGKTHALEQLQAKLVTRSGITIPSVYFSASQRDVNTIAGVYRMLCNSVKLTHTKHDRADHLADAMVCYLADLADKNKCETLVLYVDEMQRLTIKQLDVFAELFDRLQRLKIHLMTVFVGNAPECFDLLDLSHQTKFAHIRGRFLTQLLEFKGLQDAEDVRKCLQQYDSIRFPENGPSITEYFLPVPVSQGFTLASLSTELWQYYCEFVKGHDIKSWGMQYFMAATNCLVMDSLPKFGVDAFSQEMVDEVLKVSGIVGSQVRNVP